MKLKVSEIYLGFKNKIFKISANDLPDRGTVYRSNFIIANLSIIKESNYFYLNGSLKANIEYICVRCLNDFPYSIDQPINILMFPDTEKYTPNTNMDIIHINKSNDYVVLNNIFADLIALSEPLKPLCDEKCSGLCSNCGIEKTTQCSCNTQRDTSAWEKLKEMQI